MRLPLELHQVTGTSPGPSLQPLGQGQPCLLGVARSDWSDPIFKRPVGAPLSDSLPITSDERSIAAARQLLIPTSISNLGHGNTHCARKLRAAAVAEGVCVTNDAADWLSAAKASGSRRKWCQSLRASLTIDFAQAFASLSGGYKLVIITQPPALQGLGIVASGGCWAFPSGTNQPWAWLDTKLEAVSFGARISVCAQSYGTASPLCCPENTFGPNKGAPFPWLRISQARTWLACNHHR